MDLWFMNTNVITFDGFSGTGKGTISIMLAKKIGFHYLDSGALYRILAYKIVESKDRSENWEIFSHLAV